MTPHRRQLLSPATLAHSLFLLTLNIPLGEALVGVRDLAALLELDLDAGGDLAAGRPVLDDISVRRRRNLRKGPSRVDSRAAHGWYVLCGVES